MMRRIDDKPTSPSTRAPVGMGGIRRLYNNFIITVEYVTCNVHRHLGWNRVYRYNADRIASIEQDVYDGYSE